MASAERQSYLFEPKGSVSVLLASHLAEDHAAMRDIFTHSNWELKEAWSCEEALFFFKTQDVPVVVCACDLPEVNWKRLMEESFQLPLPPRVIVSSRLADELLWAEVLNWGGYDLLATPYDASEVFRVAFLAFQSWKNSRNHRMAKPLAAHVPEPERNTRRLGARST